VKKGLLVLALVLFASQSAWAHSMWVAAYGSFTHPPGHALVHVNFGHQIPMDDLLTGDYGKVQLAKYQLTTPDGETFDLPMPDFNRKERHPLGKTLSAEKGDLGITKINLTPESAAGTYQVSARATTTFFTQYKDKKGRMKYSQKTLDTIDDLGTVLFSGRYNSVAKSFFSNGPSAVPASLGHDLEITPLVDPCALKAGDMLPVSVTYRGKPLSSVGADLARITAFSNTFGGPDNFMLMAYIYDGKAQFRLPAAGEWVLGVHVMKDVDKDPSLADLKGKTKTSFHGATMSVIVKP